MAMKSLNISLPGEMKRYVEGQVASGDYGTPSEFIRDLIRKDKLARVREIEASLLSALDSKRIKLPVEVVRGRGLVRTLRERSGKR